MAPKQSRAQSKDQEDDVPSWSPVRPTPITEHPVSTSTSTTGEKQYGIPPWVKYPNQPPTSRTGPIPLPILSSQTQATGQPVKALSKRDLSQEGKEYGIPPWAKYPNQPPVRRTGLFTLPMLPTQPGTTSVTNAQSGLGDVGQTQLQSSQEPSISRPTRSECTTSGSAQSKKTLPKGTYLVEDIIGHKFEGKNKYYLIKWVGYRTTSWEPSQIMMEDIPDMVKDYEQLAQED